MTKTATFALRLAAALGLQVVTAMGGHALGAAPLLAQTPGMAERNLAAISDASTGGFGAPFRPSPALGGYGV